MNIRLERNKAMRKAYAMARQGNTIWTQLWINRAGDFFPVSDNQLAYAQKLLNAARTKVPCPGCVELSTKTGVAIDFVCEVCGGSGEVMACRVTD